MKYPEQDFSPKPHSPDGYIRLGSFVPGQKHDY